MMHGLVQKTTTAVGGVTIAYILYRVYTWLSFHLAPESTLERYKRADERSWALITGSSQGIGFGYALELARRGFDIVLLAHVKEEVDAAEQRIKEAYPETSVRSLYFNVTTASSDEVQGILDATLDLRLTILINNVGGAPIEHPAFRHLGDYAVADVDNSINMNARFMACLSSLIIPVLKRNGPSLLVNVSSAGRVGLPLLSMYSACKSFNLALSRAITRECRSSGSELDCICIVPGDVLSHGNSQGVTPGSPDANYFAKVAIGRIDAAVSRGMLDMMPYWQHSIQAGILDWLPESLRLKFLVQGMEHKQRAFDKAR